VFLSPEGLKGPGAEVRADANASGSTAADAAGDAVERTRLETAAFEGLLGKLGSDVARYVPAAIVPAAVSVGSVAVFTRIFGADAYGQYALVAAVCTLAAAVGAGWIQQGILRYLPRYLSEGALHEFFAQLLLLLIMTTAVWAVIALAGSPVVGRLGAYRVFYVPAACLVVGEMLFLALNTLFQSLLRSTAYAAYRVAAAVLRFALALAFVLLVERSVVGLVVGSAAGYLLLVVPMVKSIHPPPLKRVLRSFDGRFVRMFAAYGAPMIGWMFVGQILNLSDRFVIGAFRGSMEVGIYSANYTLVTMALGLLSTPILMAAHPIIMGAWERGVRSDITRMIGLFSRYYLITVVPFVVMVAVLSKDIAGLFLGEEFREGHRIIPFVLAGVAVWGFSMYGHKPLELLERTRTMLVIAVACAVVNIGLNLAFVPRWGYYAAAVTTLASYALYPMCVFLVLRKSYPWKVPGRTLLAAAAASAVMAVAVLWCRSVLLERVSSVIMMVLAGTAGAVAYGACLVAFGELRGEIRMLRNRRSRR
jgi:O-antigen/teichoic acid export membrane protein